MFKWKKVADFPDQWEITHTVYTNFIVCVNVGTTSNKNIFRYLKTALNAHEVLDT